MKKEQCLSTDPEAVSQCFNITNRSRIFYEILRGAVKKGEQIDFKAMNLWISELGIDDNPVDLGIAKSFACLEIVNSHDKDRLVAQQVFDILLEFSDTVSV